LKKILKYGLTILIAVILIVLGINYYVVLSTKNQIIKEQSELENLTDIDCIIVLGAGVWGDRPSPMLEDRLKKGIELYKAGISQKIIMSGDHGQVEYDEVNIMKEYAINKGVLSSELTFLI